MGERGQRSWGWDGAPRLPLKLPALPALPAPGYDPARPLLGPRAFCQDPGSLERLRFCQQGFPEEVVERG